MSKNTENQVMEQEEKLKLLEEKRLANMYNWLQIHRFLGAKKCNLIAMALQMAAEQYDKDAKAASLPRIVKAFEEQSKMATELAERFEP